MNGSKRDLRRLATLACVLLLCAVSNVGEASVVRPKDKRFRSIVNLLAEPAGLHGQCAPEMEENNQEVFPEECKLSEGRVWRRMVPMYTWSTVSRSVRSNDFHDWVLRQVHRQSASSEQPPLPYNCQVFVNHRYKFAYIRHPKTGSTAIFSRALGGVCGKKNNKPTCMVDLQGAGWDLARRVWSHYYIFTFVRNPWARASSARDFLNMMNRMQDPTNTHQASPCAYPRFAQFCCNPLLAARTCSERAECCRYGAAFEWHHLQSQARCMFTSEGVPAVDFIGRSEYSNEDFKQLIAILNKRRDPRVPPIEAPPALEWHKPQKLTPRQVLEMHARDYLGSPSCLESISRHWWQDVQWLGFPRISPDGISGSSPIAWHRPAVSKKQKH